MKTFEEIRMTNPIVHRVLDEFDRQPTAEALQRCVVEIHATQERLMKRLEELESIAPKRVLSPAGKSFIWHCPDELVPAGEAEGEFRSPYGPPPGTIEKPYGRCPGS